MIHHIVFDSIPQAKWHTNKTEIFTAFIIAILLQAAAKAAKKDAKMAKMLQEEELRILFNEGTLRHLSPDLVQFFQGERCRSRSTELITHVISQIYCVCFVFRYSRSGRQEEVTEQVRCREAGSARAEQRSGRHVG